MSYQKLYSVLVLIVQNNVEDVLPLWMKDRQSFTFNTFTPPVNLSMQLDGEEAGVPGETPHRHGESVQTPLRNIQEQPGNEPGTL